ncbi:hypothetical protein [Paenibacillus thalictri]|nr:hypothetical protein [Paenibacillus thalictri]
MRYGNDEPLPEKTVLHAGPLSAVFEAGMLRDIRFGGIEVVRGLYSAVRDSNWGTIVPVFTEMSISRQPEVFEVAFTAVHQRGDIDFAWKGQIKGTSGGLLEFTMDGAAGRRFYKNRIGFCILHPMELAGTPTEVKTPDGWITGHFPQVISPHQPFPPMTGIRYAVQGRVKAELAFTGELFEMEDQRNWTDASFKTYCTPLAYPYPAEVRQGERFCQKITLQASALTNSERLERSATTGQIRLIVDEGRRQALPSIGMLLPKHDLKPKEMELVRRLNPGHMRAELDLTTDLEWSVSLQEALDTAQGLQLQLELDLIADGHGERLAELTSYLALNKRAELISRMFLYEKDTHVSSEALLQLLRQLMVTAGIAVAVGGGSRAYFAQFNRAILPLSHMDWAAYSINPQVHAFDLTSLVETLAAQAATVSSAAVLTGGLPLSVGPVTLKKRFNPDAAGTTDGLSEEERSDPRQQSLFCAAWTLGSLNNLSVSEIVQAITYYETFGDRGVAADAACMFPVFHILADIGDFRGGELMAASSSAPQTIEALGLHKDGRTSLLIANLTAETQAVTVEFAEAKGRNVRKLDEDTFEEAMYESETYRNAVHESFCEAVIRLALKPYAVVRIDPAEQPSRS